MIFGNKRRIASLLVAVCLLFTAEFQVFAADPQSKTHLTVSYTYEDVVSPLKETWNRIPEIAACASEIQDWYGKALANTDTVVDVLDEKEGNVIAKLHKNTIVTVEAKENEWVKVSSGNIVGYVKKEALLFGKAADERANVTCAQGTRDAQLLTEYEEEQKKNEMVRVMAALIYCEAGNQPYKGKVAVGSVVMNRISSPRFPNTFEGVVYQRGQFTPAMSGKLAKVLESNRIPASCYEAAIEAIAGAKPVGGALFFNTRSGKIKLGDHYFS